MLKIIDKLNNHLSQELPFAIYSEPYSDVVQGIFQKNNSLHRVVDFTEKGFVFYSLDKTKSCLIPEAQSEIINAFRSNFDVDIPNSLHSNIIENQNAKKDFEALVSDGICAIEKGDFEKVVLSRKETVFLSDIDVVLWFQKLLILYPSAFISCFYHKKIGLWLGATPETFLKINANCLETVALAGTQKDVANKKLIWGQKEISEQQYVTDFIVSQLRKCSDNVSVSNPYNLKAGSIWHIKTDINCELKNNFELKNIIDLLHPTPAVCGFPRESALNFILENEGYDRGFYSGFLGKLNMNLQTSLYVNLRCMEIVEDKAVLYMGCGITRESNPEKEWEESLNKSMTMKNILNINSNS